MGRAKRRRKKYHLRDIILIVALVLVTVAVVNISNNLLEEVKHSNMVKKAGFKLCIDGIKYRVVKFFKY